MKKLLVIISIILLICGSFLAGMQSRSAQAEPARSAASMVCLGRDTALRTSPTGYIIFRLPKGAQLWVNRIESPFAYVSYFDGSRWFDGSVTAAYLGRCGAEDNREG